MNTTDRGHLKWAMRSRQNAISSASSASRIDRRVGGLHDRPDRLAHLRVGHADHRDVRHARMERSSASSTSRG